MTDTPLAFEIRYVPAWESTFRPYARFVVTSAARPGDSFKSFLEEYGLGDEETIDNLSWRFTTLDVRAGIETDLSAELFLRTGLLYNHTDEQGMIDPLVEEVHLLMDFSTQTRDGLFVSVGKRFNLKRGLLDSSLVMSHYIGRSVGGGAMDECDGSDSGYDLGEMSLGDFCTRSRSDFVSGQTMIGVDNHLNIGPVALSAALLYGKTRSSKRATEWAEDVGDTSGLNPSFYDAMLTVGYEFGH